MATSFPASPMVRPFGVTLVVALTWLSAVGQIVVSLLILMLLFGKKADRFFLQDD